MKRIFTLLSVVIGLSAFAQTPVNLNIYHKLGAADFAYNQVAQNNMSNGSFKLTRMEYYITKISVIHDGGMTTSISNDTIALVKANELTSIALGNLNVTSIEGVKFYVGVHTPVNHEDPSLLPLDHPLSFQSPSMHWGWTSGYRFIALEGKSGSSVNQTMELHGLGDNNYFQTTVMATANLFNGELYINVDADYERGLENIAISSGPIVHGSSGEAAAMVANFRDYVFSASGSTAGLSEQIKANIKIFPVPSNGNLTVEIPDGFEGDALKIFNTKGQVVAVLPLKNGAQSVDVQLYESGVYILEFYNKDAKLFSMNIINR